MVVHRTDVTCPPGGIELEAVSIASWALMIDPAVAKPAWAGAAIASSRAGSRTRSERAGPMQCLDLALF